MQAKGLFYGFGMEAYQASDSRLEKTKRDSYHLILVAKNQEGYRNLLRLSDESNRSGFYYTPRVDWDLLQRYHEGIICTSACLGSLLCQTIMQDGDANTVLSRYRNIFKDDFYIEIGTYDSADQRAVNMILAEMAEEWSAPLVYANDAHYLTKDQHQIHELMMAMNMNKSLTDTDYKPIHKTPSLYIMGEDEVRTALDYLPEGVVDSAIANSDHIASLCSATLPATRLHLPKFQPITEEPSNESLLIDLVEQGIEELYGDDEVAWARAEYELDAIINGEVNLTDYFLIVWDYIEWAKRRDIMVGPGRGSVGGSIIAYALGITCVDPIKYGLYFERFWNPGRAKGLPDIDVDVEVTRRGEVKAYIERRYGEDRVLQIGNHIRLRAKSALDKVAKAMYGRTTPYIDLKKIKGFIDETTDAGQMKGWDEIWEEKQEELKPFLSKYPELFEKAEYLSGRISTYGVHASAVVVSDISLSDVMPSMLRTAKDDEGTAGEKVLATQIEMHAVEAAGFMKLDVLGLRNLDTFKKTMELANVPDFDYRTFDYESLPLDYWQQIDNGRTLGLFQIEDGNAARRIGKKLRPRNLLDLAAIVALNRPGPLRSGATDRYLERRQEEGAVFFSAHEVLQPILAESYGDFLYQEQVIQYCEAIGYTPSEADEIRKILGKKLGEEMKVEEKRYLDHATQFMPIETAVGIWQDIIGFSKYSFNKSHALCYGTTLAWTMYAKWAYPAEFIMASIMTNPKRVGDYVKEGNRLGVGVSPPDINKSEVDISINGNDIYFGLRDIKKVGGGAAAWVVSHRPYTSYTHFLEVIEVEQAEWEQGAKNGRSPRQTVPKHMAEAMFHAGAFDSIGGREQMTITEKSEFEEELLGISLTDPTELVREIHAQELANLDRIVDVEVGKYSVPGMIVATHMSRTSPEAWKNPNEEMAFVNIEWDGEELRFAAFPEQYRRYKFMLNNRVIGRFDIEATERGNQLVRGKRFL